MINSIANNLSAPRANLLDMIMLSSGDQGDRGDQGNQGNQGTQGDQGNHGNQNDQGQDDQGGRDEHDNHDDQGGHDDQGKPDLQVTCPVSIREDITITVPVEVHAHADVKNIKLECKGHHIDKESKVPKNVSKFEVVQEISAQIPIEFVTKVEVKEERVDFKLH